MKVIQIMPEFGLAGAEIMCENLIYELYKRGNDVYVISLYDYHSPITERLEASGIKIEYLSKKSGLDFSMIPKMIKVFGRENPDIIHTHRYVMQYAIPAAILSGVKKRIHTVHNVADKEVGKIARILAKLFYRYCSVIPIALSNLIHDSIINEYGINTKQIPIILNGIDLSRCIVKSSYGVEEVFKILHIGRFSTQKNHWDLIQAFKIFHEKYPQSVLQLVGDGELRKGVEEYIEEHGLKDHVQFLGLKSDVYPYLRDADIFTLPSKWEGIPMTLIEAMGTGLPIVATNVGGVPDMLVNGESAIITKVDVKQIAGAFERLYSDENLRETLGKSALIKSVSFSSETMAEAYMKIYKSGMKGD